MKNLEILEMQEVTGGDFINGFCAGFGGVAAVYGTGVLFNLWNPPGMVAGIAMGVVGIGCAAKGIYDTL